MRCLNLATCVLSRAKLEVNFITRLRAGVRAWVFVRVRGAFELVWRGEFARAPHIAKVKQPTRTMVLMCVPPCSLIDCALPPATARKCAQSRLATRWKSSVSGHRHHSLTLRFELQRTSEGVIYLGDRQMPAHRPSMGQSGECQGQAHSLMKFRPDQGHSSVGAAADQQI